MGRALYITHDGLTDPLGRSQIIPYLQGLSEKGHRITVISSEKPKRYFTGKQEVSALLSAAGIAWLPCPYVSTLPLVSKYGNLKKLERQAMRLCRKERFDLVHCRGYMASVIGLKLKRRYGLKFIFDMRGFWADERVDGKIWSLSNPLTRAIYRYFKRKETEFLNNADFVISLTETGKNELLSWKGVKRPPAVEVIPCCVDLDHFSPERVTSEKLGGLRNRLGIRESDFILSYIGSLGTWYMPDKMLLFFRELLQVRPNARFLFVTPDGAAGLIAAAGRAGLDRSRIIVTESSRGDMPAYIALSHLSVYFIQPLFSKKASSPTKMAEIMAMGIPAVINAGIGDTEQVMRDSGAGIVLSDLSEKTMRTALAELDLLLGRDKRLLRASAKKHFSLDQGVERYDRVYNQVLNKM
ncbi:MAG: glycosyltransferase [Bacteroidota bacterium]